MSTARAASESSSATSPGDTQRILDALRRLVRELRRGAPKARGKSAGTPARNFVLQQIAAAEPLSLSEVAARTHTDPSSVSVVVSHLVDAGLVKRTRAAADGRKVELVLTAAGRAAAKRAPAAAQHRLIAGIAALSDPKRARLARLLVELAGHVVPDGDGEPAPLFFEDAPARSRPRPRSGR